VLSAVLLAVLPACFGGWSIKEPPRSSGAPPPQREETLYYKVDRVTGVTIGDGESGLRDGIRENRVFANVAQLPEPVDNGLWVHARAVYRAPHIATLVWAYVDYLVFYATLPIWLNGGYDIHFRVYRDAEMIREYEYPARYWMFGWVVALPLMWINALTDSEYDTFREATERFFIDASEDGVFEPNAKPPPEDEYEGLPKA